MTLDEEIEHWVKIQKKHFDDYCNPKTGNIRKYDRLLAKAQSVVGSLRHYKIELDGS